MREKQKHNTTPASTSTQPVTHRGLVPEVSKLVGKIITTELVFRPLAVVKNGGGGCHSMRGQGGRREQAMSQNQSQR